MDKQCFKSSPYDRIGKYSYFHHMYRIGSESPEINFTFFQLVAHGEPTVLTHTPFDSWRSVNWTPSSSLASEISLVLSRKGTHNVFRYFALDQPLASAEALAEVKPYNEIVYSGDKFFRILQSDFDGFYYYASGGLEQLDLAESVHSEDSLKMLTFPSQGNALGQVNYWFGKENVTAYTHYDTSYNLHAVIYGRKKFLLFAPVSYRELGLYPCLHEFYRQVHADTLNRSVVESLETPPIEVELGPGEVLYIPPYWFHIVVTMETTISLNVWSNSESYLIMEEVFAAPIPFEEDWGREKLLKALQYYIDLLVEGLVDEDGLTGSFVTVAVFSRYEPLLKRLSVEQAQTLASVVRDSYCLGRDSLDEQSLPVDYIDEGARRILRLLSGIHSQAALEINLANYIENLTWRIVGTEDVLILPFYFWECFQ